MSMFSIATLATSSKEASQVSAVASTFQKNKALVAIAQELDKHAKDILSANNHDMQSAQVAGLSQEKLERLELTRRTISEMVQKVHDVCSLSDPIGEINETKQQPSGISVGKMRIPLGVICMIYESRPNVTVEASALSVKSGNAAILRGGSEAFKSNQVLVDCIQSGLEAANLPKEIVQLVPTKDRKAIKELLHMDKFIDLIIPRGGKDLIESIVATSKIPVLKHLDGNCHLYIDNPANLQMAIAIADNAKNHRYGVCNAIETLLVHQDISKSFLPEIAHIYSSKDVEMRCCPKTMRTISSGKLATEEDWLTEYHAPIISIRVVDTIDEAINHINLYGSHHTDAIVTSDHISATRFLREIDSSSVMVNASTRFADGHLYGLGAEIGISTNKLHARGPVGLIGLTTEKFVVYGNGQVRE